MTIHATGDASLPKKAHIVFSALPDEPCVPLPLKSFSGKVSLEKSPKRLANDLA